MGLVSKQGEEDDEQGPEVLITGFGDLEARTRDKVELDLSDWSDTARAALVERMKLLEAPHAWNGSWLVVAEDDAAWIERIVDQVEDERSVQFDPDADQVGYDLAEWDDDNRGRLLHLLEDEEIAYGLEDDELVVHEIDELRVDEIVDSILTPDAPPPAGGEARTEIMGKLFVAADRLVHDPTDAAGRTAVGDGAREAAEHAPPYGMDKAWWSGLGERCADLARLLELPGASEEQVVDLATQLRDQLRPYV